nr:monovalent cation/H(+) antiporter subunit G [Canibacter zhuwentaonis]
MVICSGLLSIAASVGLLRFTDTLSRLHAATKPQILGLLLIIFAAAFYHGSIKVLFVLIPVFILQSLIAPVSAHMAARTAYRAGHIDATNLVVDELDPVIQKANTGVLNQAGLSLPAEESAELIDPHRIHKK